MVSYNIVLKTRQYASFKCYRWEEWGKTPPPPPSPFGIAAGPPQMLLPDTSSGLLPAFSSKAITVLFRREWITQHFQIKPLNPQMSARGCQQSRHQHLQPHSFCHAPPPSNISCYFTSTRLTLSCMWDPRRRGIVVLQSAFFVEHPTQVAFALTSEAPYSTSVCRET